MTNEECFAAFSFDVLIKYKIIIQQQAPSAAFKIVCAYIYILSMNAFFVAQRSLREGSGGFFASRDVSVRVFRPPRASSVDGEI